MCTTKTLGNMLWQAATHAAGAALCGAVGASILDKSGYTEYSPLEATRMGAAGGAVLGAASSVIRNACCFFREEQPITVRNKSWQEVVGEMANATGIATFSGLMGHFILKTVTQMPLNKTAAAMAVGSAVCLGGGAVATVLVLGSYLLCCQRPRVVEEPAPPPYRAVV